ncbi:neurotrimin-like [Anabrus simplex]|uniref:neurotrimin-like n=1 Tax=Anabrus simplex TaxID=316456 RepID=UPI0035A33BCE
MNDPPDTGQIINSALQTCYADPATTPLRINPLDLQSGLQDQQQPALPVEQHHTLRTRHHEESNVSTGNLSTEQGSSTGTHSHNSSNIKDNLDPKTKRFRADPNLHAEQLIDMDTDNENASSDTTNDTNASNQLSVNTPLVAPSSSTKGTPPSSRLSQNNSFIRIANCIEGKALMLNFVSEVPKFGEPITNVTVPVGREATLACVVDDLATYKVAWLRVDTQTILTIATHVITKNHRIGVTQSDRRTWYLHIKEVRENDRGWYMCQINTDPMKSQLGFLEVVVPPDILDYPTSTDMVVREGTNVTLRCAATGSPQPNITWRREGGEPIPLANGLEVLSVEGPVFTITRVNRLHMGAYLCIASNGVPPTVSKRIMLIVHFPPMIWIQNQLVGAHEGQQMTLECHSEAYPKSINYWTRDKGEIIAQGGKYEPVLLDNAYKVHMKLTIRSVGPSDFGSYKCVSKNSLGDTDGSIKLYRKCTTLSVTLALLLFTRKWGKRLIYLFIIADVTVLRYGILG